MTTIAFDGRTIVADLQSQLASRKIRESKLHKIELGANIYFAAFCGSSRFQSRILAWLTENLGHAPKDRTEFPQAIQGESHMAVVVIRDGEGNHKLECYESDKYPEVYQLDQTARHAFGSGAHFALGAMAMGANAATAVKVANALDVNTGFGYEGYILDSAERFIVTLEPDWNADVPRPEPVAVAEEVDE